MASTDPLVYMAATVDDIGSTLSGTMGLADESLSVTQISSSLKNRKGDILYQSDDSDEEEADEDEDEEVGLCFSYSWSKWGVDAFVTFDLNLPDEWAREGYRDKWLLYKRVVSESEGFVVEPENNPGGATRAVYPLSLDQEIDFENHTVHQLAKEVASVALERYNQEKGSNVKLESVVRVNWRRAIEAYFYVTFMARESADGDVVEYQTKFCYVIGGDDYYPIFCRPAPKTMRRDSKS